MRKQSFKVVFKSRVYDQCFGVVQGVVCMSSVLKYCKDVSDCVPLCRRTEQSKIYLQTNKPETSKHELTRKFEQTHTRTDRQTNKLHSSIT